MSEPPRADGGGAKHDYDFAQAERILQALDFLRGEALKTGIPEIVTMVEATFAMLSTTYYSILRYEMTKFSCAEMVQ